MMPAGNWTVLVADPAEGKQLWDQLDGIRSGAGSGLPGGPDFSSETIGLFDSVAQRCREVGYRVVRIPTAAAADGRTYLTYVNVILDHRAPNRQSTCSYANAGPLNERAAEIWAGLATVSSAGLHDLLPPLRHAPLPGQRA